MHLYIVAYGLTTLRIVTLWGIAMILLALLAAIVKVFLPNTKICPILAVIVLTTWIGLNYTNIDRIVVGNQVARYNSSMTAEIKQAMTRQEWENRLSNIFSDQYWNPDYYSALNKLEEPPDRTIALSNLKARGQKETYKQIHRIPPLYDWNLSFMKVPKD